ncbi:MAG: AbrB/MazE/SpoVT family DNA-binding domain-containing protein [Neisseriaceae bacterium]
MLAIGAVMHVKLYKNGRISLPLKLRKKFNFNDGDDLIITECEDGIKITNRELILQELYNEFIGIDLIGELKRFRSEEFDLDKES